MVLDVFVWYCTMNIDDGEDDDDDGMARFPDSRGAGHATCILLT